MKVCLIVPPYEEYRIGESLSIRYLTAFLRWKGIDCFCLDAPLHGWEQSEIVKHISDSGYEVVGLSIHFSEILEKAIPLFKELKSNYPSIHLVIGGYLPTFASLKILSLLPEIDSVVCGEGEIPLINLIKSLEQGQDISKVPGVHSRNMISPNRGKRIHDLDLLPIPYRDDLKEHEISSISLLTSRGCSFHCSFCSIPSFYRNYGTPFWRARSPKNVINEIITIIDSFKSIDSLSFVDDNFLGSSELGKNRAREISQLLLSNGLNKPWTFECRTNDVEYSLFRLFVDSGLKHISLGVESGSDRLLNNFKKGTNVSKSREAIKILSDLNISILPHCILFHPFTDKESILKTLQLFREMGHLNFVVLTSRWYPYEGTEDFSRFKTTRLSSKGIFTYTWTHKEIKIDQIWSFWDLLEPIFAPFEGIINETQYSSDIKDDSILQNELNRIRQEYSDRIYHVAEKLVFLVFNEKMFDNNDLDISLESIHNSILNEYEDILNWLRTNCNTLNKVSIS